MGRRVEARPGPLLALLGLPLLYLLVVARGGREREAVSVWEEAPGHHRNPHPYSLLLDPGRGVCGEERVELLVLVASALHHRERRRAVRETWGQGRHGVRLVFLLGRQAEGKVEQVLEEELGEEWEDYGDMVREDYIDSYQNLTLKTLGGMKWASLHCPQAEWVMKTDDDMYVNVPLLLDHLHQAHPSPSRTITGCVKNGPQGAPQPIGMEGAVFKPVHPPFTAGAGYLLSGDLPADLYAASRDLHLIKVEDAFLTGYCAKALGGVNRVHHAAFSCGQLVGEDCDMGRLFTGHKVTANRMRRIHSAMRRGDCAKP